MNSFWIRMLSVFVFVLGLSACTPDKPQKKEDQWRLSPPELVLPGDGDARARLKTGEAILIDLPLSATLQFSDHVSLEVDSVCITNERREEETFFLSQVKQFKLGSIVAGRSLLRKGAMLECSFEFVAINQHGSRHRFTLAGMKLTEDAAFGSLVVSEKLRRISPTTEVAPVVEVNDLDQIAIDSNLRNGIAELICSDFISRERFSSVDTIDWKKLAYKQPAEVLEQVLKKFKQPCRFALVNSDGIREQFSSFFIIRYAAPALGLSASAPAFSSGWQTEELNLLSLELRNDSNIDQYFSLVNGLTAETRAVWGTSESTPEYFLTKRLRDSAINYRISVPTVQVIGGKAYFEVKAQSTVTLEVLATDNTFKTFNAVGILHGGFHLKVSKPIRLERVEQFGDATAVEEIQIFKMLEHHIYENQIYVPHYKVTGSWAEIALALREKTPPRQGD